MNLARPDAPVIVAARRSHIGTVGRGHRDRRAHELAAPVLAAVLADVRAQGVDALVGDVILGSCTGPRGNLARVSALAAGLGLEVPGLTVDRQCGSGLAAVLLGAQTVQAGDAGLVLAGGVESASTSVEPAQALFAPPGFPDPLMGPAADALAAARGVTRERQDAYAARSHARSLAAQGAGAFADETVRIGGLDRDEHARRLDPTLLARLRPAFTPDGTVTAATSSPISDGAAVLALVPEPLRGRAPGLRVLAGAVVGCDPALPGRGAVPAVRAALARAGADLADIVVVEIVEAFAAQVLAVTDELGLDALGADAHRICPDGGAIALGHPWGASAAVSVVRLFTRLVRGGAPAGSLGLATAAVGGGMGVAMLVEVVR